MKTRKNPNHISQIAHSYSFIRFYHRVGIILICLVTVLTFQSKTQDLDVPYVPTPNDVLEQMLDLADVGPGDYVIDLGSGDGRIVIAAAKRGAVGHGVDLDPDRIQEARANAEEEGVSDRVMFMQGDIFETDFSDASVITLYLLSSVNEKLRPSLLEELSPGTQVVSHSFSMGDWEADNQIRYANRTLYYWVIPARVEGIWEWEVNGQTFSMEAFQKYQEVDMSSASGGGDLAMEEITLKGPRLNIILNDNESETRYIYSGVVEGDSINGTVQIHSENSQSIEDWSAMRNAE